MSVWSRWNAVLIPAVFLFGTSVPSFSQEAPKDAIKAEPNHYRLDFENDSVEVVNVHYGPHEKSKLHSHPGGVVVVLTPGHLRFTDEEGKTREVNALRGEARWFPPLKHSVENLGNTSYDAVYIGLKSTRKSAQASSPNDPAVKAVVAALVSQLHANDTENASPQKRISISQPK